ncbi:MAG: adenylate kinase [Chloroflexia bacterium]|nr:adenylate kinase [Chloroflexia bacterium]
MHVILMGAQGSGKGTQASLLGPALRLTKIATGDLFRAEIASASPLGVELKAILDRGDLVPDDLTNAIVRGRIAALVERRASGEDVAGALFDGFPRTDAQARALDGILGDLGETVTVVIEIDVPREVLISRLSGRRVCVSCGAVYHVESNPPEVEGVCEMCGGEVIQRDDDKPEAIKRRLALFDQQTAPLLDYYDAQGKLTRVDGDRSVLEVQESILAVIKLRLTGSGLPQA